MDIDKNDFVVVNGKRYYSTGGVLDKKPKKRKQDNNIDEFSDGKPYHVNSDYSLTINKDLPQEHIKSLETISPIRQRIMYEFNNNPKEFEKHSTKKISDLNEQDDAFAYNDPEVGTIYMRKSGNNVFFDADAQDYGLDSYFWYKNGLPITRTTNGIVQVIPKNQDIDFLINNGSDSNKKINLSPEHWLVKEGMLPSGIISAREYQEAVRKANFAKKYAPTLPWYTQSLSKKDLKNIDYNTLDNSAKLWFARYNPDAYKYMINSPKRKHALGGPTSRLYAVGGLTGEQVPLGEQEDYNMVGAGGSHEANPQGGVPYGMNQDGSQNMVEEGEVTVGNNVFSDRIQLSPELCQQLGLPEGTTPAQAMQQIEQLYEQGQIGNDEFQEIQNIIFQDQESQKQGEEMQQEMPPNEGISPDMIQGANMPQGGGMPPEMMQRQGAPMPQTEGITPDMVQGYAYGGRMW